MKRFILGLIIGFAVLFAVPFIYFTTGMAPVAAAAKPMPFERYLLGAAFRARLEREAPKTVPIQATPENMVEGAKVYQQNCAFCHGLPHASVSPEGRGMYPGAPQFFAPRPNFAFFRGRGPGRGRGPEGERGRGRGEGRRGPTLTPQQRQARREEGIGRDFWRVQNGIRMTGMPSFEKALSNQQMWDVVVMLSQRRNLPPAATAVLSPTAAAPAAKSKPGTTAKPAAAPKRPSK